MRILVVSPFYPSMESPHEMAFVHTRCRVYQRHGHRVLVFVPDESKSKTYFFEGIMVIRQRFRFIHNIVSSFDPDVIIIHGPSGWWLKYLLISKSPKAWVKYFDKLSRPIIIWFHGSETLIRAFNHYISPFGLRNNVGKVISLPIDIIKLVLLRFVLSISTAVVYVANWLREMSQKYTGYIHPLSFVIPNPIDTTLFKPREIDYSKINKAVSIRSLEWKYGLDIAIKAFAHLKNVSLTILGRGSMERYLRELARKNHAPVKFITHYMRHEDLSNFIAQYGFFIAPSRLDAQGVVMCEAMSVGLPVIATRVAGIPEFVLDGYNGILVPPEDPIAVRRAVLKLTNNKALYEELSRNAIRFVRENLSQEVIYRKEYRVMRLAIENY